MKNVCDKIATIWEQYPEIEALSFEPIIDDLTGCYSFSIHFEKGSKVYWIEFYTHEFDIKKLLQEIDNDLFQTGSFQDYCFEMKVKGDRVRDFILAIYTEMLVLDENGAILLLDSLIKVQRVNKNTIKSLV